MAWTSADVTMIEVAIRDLILGARTVSLTMGDKSITYDRSDLPALRALRDEIKTEVGAATGACSPRTYARQGGRGI